MMDWAKDVHYLQIDATSYCNAGCGTCVRFVPKTLELQPHLELDHFPLDIYTRLIKEDIKDLNIKALFFNGNWGDACMHPKLIDFVKLAREADLYIKISTNGSIRTEKWWAELAEVIGSRGDVTFCIDGVGNESNAMYRAKTSYDKIVKNMTAFNNAGGSSRWQMTVFDYNIDQIDEAESLAKSFGCNSFEARPNYSDSKQIIYPTHTITLNSVNTSMYKTTLLKEIDEETAKYTSLYWPHQSEKQIDSQCPWYSEGGIQIDPFATVWPCCITSQTKYGLTETGDKVSDADFADGSLADRFSLKTRTLKEILTDKWYTQYLDNKVESAGYNICVEECDVENRL
jgi:MoaA/NifB/PqqE/SkfB family radical SAM enzyme